MLSARASQGWRLRSKARDDKQLFDVCVIIVRQAALEYAKFRKYPVLGANRRAGNTRKSLKKSHCTRKKMTVARAKFAYLFYFLLY
jgi:hypothetical protein